MICFWLELALYPFLGLEHGHGDMDEEKRNSLENKIKKVMGKQEEG